MKSSISRRISDRFWLGVSCTNFSLANDDNLRTDCFNEKKFNNKKCTWIVLPLLPLLFLPKCTTTVNNFHLFDTTGTNNYIFFSLLSIGTFKMVVNKPNQNRLALHTKAVDFDSNNRDQPSNSISDVRRAKNFKLTKKKLCTSPSGDKWW